jgi:formiminotetrahydrofolate cyclodeaminase
MTAERTLDGYLDDVAAGTPTPGGGSVAAVVGALAAALGEMITNLTLDREAHASAEVELQAAGERLRALRQTLRRAAQADEAAYASYRTASALPRGSDAEKAARRLARQQALLEATEVPLRVARSATEVARVLETVARSGSPHLRSDAALGALLAETALRGALLNVWGNAAMLIAEDRAGVFRAEAEQLTREGREAAARAYRLATKEDETSC